MFDPVVRDGVLRVGRGGTRWLSTGWDGGFSRGPAAYLVSVPEGWECTDVGGYVTDRLAAVGFEPDGPVLLTGVGLAHARGARLGCVEVFATVGLSNPAALPMNPDSEPASVAGDDGWVPGTVNLIVGTTKGLSRGAQANLLTVVAEAKAATLVAETGFPGTTTDAVVTGVDPAGRAVEYSGSGTRVGMAARACTREAVAASLGSRYATEEIPVTVEAAAYGVSTDQRARVFRL